MLSSRLAETMHHTGGTGWRITMDTCTPMLLALYLRDVAALAGCTLAELRALEPSWDDLALDNYLKDGGRYRRRRHSCFVQDDGELVQTPHRAHWQPVEYNALHGGMHRLFEPIAPATIAAPA